MTSAQWPLHLLEYTSNSILQHSESDINKNHLKEIEPYYINKFTTKNNHLNLTLCGTEAGDQRGGEWEPIKISSEIQTVGLYPENHPSPQAFWPKFGITMEKLNQHKRPRTSERNHKANRKRIGELQN